MNEPQGVPLSTGKILQKLQTRLNDATATCIVLETQVEQLQEELVVANERIAELEVIEKAVNDAKPGPGVEEPDYG